MMTVAVFAAATLSAATASAAACAISPTPLVPKDPTQCLELLARVERPSALPLDAYESVLNEFFGNWCHRDTANGWRRDKAVRDTGPYTATLQEVNGTWQWIGDYHGTHAPVVIWYSPKMAAWLTENRPADGPAPGAPTPPPDGAVMVKEMYPAPAAACAGIEPTRLFPGDDGAAIMVRDSGAAKDGWFWGWYGWTDAWQPDWPAGPHNGLANMGFGQYCVNCHASAQHMTFADAENLAGEAGAPLVFLSQDFQSRQYLGSGPDNAARRETATKAIGSSEIHQQRADAAGGARQALLAGSAHADMAAVLARLGAGPGPGVPLASQTYDHVWMPADGPGTASMFVTSDQCLGCHDAGSTGLQFDMTLPDQATGKLVNLSPYATWRTSPMGLAGRDPNFYAQVASETQTFHPQPQIVDIIRNTCFGCHGIQGQRQFQIDQHQASGDDCGVFDPAVVGQIPYAPPGGQAGAHAGYGALARDGISCLACHRMVLGKAATAEHGDAPQNACVLKRQQLLNPDETGSARNFTGSFLIGPAAELYGPFAAPKVRPMEQALGIRPAENAAIRSSEMCGTCHTVHLPVFHDGKTVGRVYEQTTYPEWAFSAYRTGTSVDGPLPLGAGATPKSCQDCHMPSADAGGRFRSKIASIQEYSTFPQSQHTLGPDALDLPVREGFARHTLVGLNLFLVKMFQQFPEVLGTPTRDPMLGGKGVDPLRFTERAMLAQAATGTARIAIATAPAIDADADGRRALATTVRVDSLTGHKFPSGVGFRRAFIRFEVLDAADAVLWASGRFNGAGVLVDETGTPVTGELWWDDRCTQRITTLEHQPHFQTIRRQDQVQIYQELVSSPPLGQDPGAFRCDHHAPARGQLTTSFLSICAEVKDNRLPPKGYLGPTDRKRIAAAIGAGDDLAEDTGFTAVGSDPDYAFPADDPGGSLAGGDALDYVIPLDDIDGTPAAVRATLYYQATPPFYLQDRFCTADGDDTRRLAYLAGHLDLKDTQAENWALKVVDSGIVAIAR